MKRTVLLTVAQSLFVVFTISGCGLNQDFEKAPGSQPLHARASSTLVPARTVIIILDVSYSYAKILASVRPKVEEIIHSLGPGDRVFLVRVGGSAKFEPLLDVKVAILQGPTRELLEPARTFQDWETKQATLQRLWKAALSKKDSLGQLLDRVSKRPATSTRGTDVRAVIQYVGSLTWRGECHLFISSDLWHDAGGISTHEPPSEPVPLHSARVVVLGMPNIWKDLSVKQAWEEYFAGCGASSVRIIEAAQVPGCDRLLPECSVPNVIASPF